MSFLITLTNQQFTEIKTDFSVCILLVKSIKENGPIAIFHCIKNGNCISTAHRNEKEIKETLTCQWGKDTLKIKAFQENTESQDFIVKIVDGI